jgi:FkbM family methyltransferase
VIERLAHLARRIREEPRPLRFLASRALWHGRVLGVLPLTMRLPEGVVLRYHPSAVSAALWVDREYGREDRDFLLRLLREGDTVVDVGANVGALALVAGQRVGPQGTVVAVEAHPRVFRFLCDNVARSAMPWVTPLLCAVAASEGRRLLSDGRSDDMNRVVADGDGIVVEARPLDELAPDGEITLLKLDVEGYEPLVIDGAAETLAHTAFVYFECFEPLLRRYGLAPDDLFQRLRGHGFAIFDPDTLAPAEPTESCRSCRNLVAARDPAMLRNRLDSAPRSS